MPVPQQVSIPVLQVEEPESRSILVGRASRVHQSRPYSPREADLALGDRRWTKDSLSRGSIPDGPEQAQDFQGWKRSLSIPPSPCLSIRLSDRVREPFRQRETAALRGGDARPTSFPSLEAEVEWLAERLVQRRILLGTENRTRLHHTRLYHAE